MYKFPQTLKRFNTSSRRDVSLFLEALTAFDTTDEDLYYFKYDEKFGVGIYAWKPIPRSTSLGLKGTIGRAISNKHDELSSKPYSTKKSIFTINYDRNGMSYSQNHILLGSAAVVNYACANHANIIANYDEVSHQNWNNSYKRY